MRISTCHNCGARDESGCRACGQGAPAHAMNTICPKCHRTKERGTTHMCAGTPVSKQKVGAR